MDKQTVIKDMKAFVGGSSFITAPAIARYFHKDVKWGYRFVNGLEKLPAEKGTLYFIPDVAAKLMEVKCQ